MATRLPRKSIWLTLLTLAVVVAVAVTARLGGRPGADAQPQKAAAKPAPLVSAEVARKVNLPVKLTTQGHLVTLNQVDVRPQFNGVVRGVHFHEGDAVVAGQLLFTLDASDAAAQLEHAKAQAAQVKAQVEDGGRELRRAQQLAKDNFISPSVVDTAAGKLDSLNAQYRAALADIATAETAFGRTRIAAPISGLTGQVSVHIGSLAQQTATAPLVSLVQMDPIGVEFTLPEASLGDLLSARAAGKVSVTLEGVDGQSLAGHLVFVNNTVNADSATVSLKAAFDNPHKLLWPGAYVRIAIDAGTNEGAIVLPPQAVLDGPDGRYVLVVGSDDIARATPVTLLRVQDHLAVVHGLKGGENVVVEGNQGLRAGKPVRVVPSAAVISPAASGVSPGGA